ncbi:glycosyltransferase [Nocardioides convexus]|uniref:glycosyltransferase n=1 Tax=Nocardioides convexus TaxID=2712224 RepID=UPI002418A6F9|nr:glycosyltransferase [Nocardioides convexus]
MAIYQTDLVGFAERYDLPGGARAMAGLTRRIHHHVDRTLAPSTASIEQATADSASRRSTAGAAAWTWPPSTRATATKRCGSGSPPTAASWSGTSAGWRRRRSLDLLTHLADDPRYALVLVGGGPDEQRLRGVLGQRATFLGLLHGDDLSRAYASLDLFVHTGRYETFCQSAQEALASAVPVVAPAAGGPIDVVAHGATGLLYRAGDGADLATCVDRLASDASLRATMGATALRAVQERSWFAINEQSAGALPRGDRLARGDPARLASGLTQPNSAAASSTVSTRCTCASIARPRESACSSGQAGSVSVQ